MLFFKSFNCRISLEIGQDRMTDRLTVTTEEEEEWEVVEEAETVVEVDTDSNVISMPSIHLSRSKGNKLYRMIMELEIQRQWTIEDMLEAKHLTVFLRGKI